MTRCFQDRSLGRCGCLRAPRGKHVLPEDVFHTLEARGGNDPFGDARDVSVWQTTCFGWVPWFVWMSESKVSLMPAWSSTKSRFRGQKVFLLEQLHAYCCPSQAGCVCMCDAAKVWMGRCPLPLRLQAHSRGTYRLRWLGWATVLGGGISLSKLLF